MIRRFSREEWRDVVQDKLEECTDWKADVAETVNVGEKRCEMVSTKQTSGKTTEFTGKWVTAKGGQIKETLSEWAAQPFLNPSLVSMKLEPIWTLFMKERMKQLKRVAKKG